MTTRAPTDIDRFVGQRVRLARKIAKLSQQKLGEIAGVTYQQVQKYENGSDRVAVSRLMQIARYLNLTPETLMPPIEGEPMPLLTDDEIAVLAAFRRIKGAPMQKAALETLKTFGAASKGLR